MTDPYAWEWRDSNDYSYRQWYEGKGLQAGNELICWSGHPVSHGHRYARRETVRSIDIKYWSHDIWSITRHNQYGVTICRSVYVMNGALWAGSRGCPEPKVGELMPVGWFRILPESVRVRATGYSAKELEI